MPFPIAGNLCYPCRMDTKRNGNAALTYLGLAAVAAVAGIVSFEHLRELGERAGEGWRAYLLPFSVDGMMIASGAAIAYAKRTGRRAPVMSWFGLFTGIVASLAANIAVAQPSVEGRLVSAWPALALLISTEILIRRLPASDAARQDVPAVPEAKLPPAVLAATERAAAAEQTALLAARRQTEIAAPAKVATIVPVSRQPLKPVPQRPAVPDAVAAARAAYRKSVADGEPLSGKALADMFDRSERWGRMQVAAAKEEK